MPSVLFLCTHNSSRSQMAEGLLRAAHGARFEVFSAGSEPSRVHPLAAQALAELGIDASTHRSEHVDAYADRPFDYVVTVCDNALEACPYLPARVSNIHHAFPDPSTVEGDEAERLSAFRRVRDDIRAWIDDVFVPAAT